MLLSILKFPSNLLHSYLDVLKGQEERVEAGELRGLKVHNGRQMHS
jgi:hypothetical protein